MNPETLGSFGVFLHRKKGEIARAESFFRRFNMISYRSTKSTFIIYFYIVGLFKYVFRR
jgi:hypothetical protein